jgi:hypothetical protein
MDDRDLNIYLQGCKPIPKNSLNMKNCKIYKQNTDNVFSNVYKFILKFFTNELYTIIQ